MNYKSKKKNYNQNVANMFLTTWRVLGILTQFHTDLKKTWEVWWSVDIDSNTQRNYYPYQEKSKIFPCGIFLDVLV